ncbi:MAG: hypothetical protein LBI64_07285 [Coriobacteriales bacterium]|jgi:plasmid stability protein|nr:hypothetical protein [Coriobacteriales bacterium]
MASVTIRNLPDEVKDEIQREAKRSGRSLESQLRLILIRYANAEPGDRSLTGSSGSARAQDWLSRD